MPEETITREIASFLADHIDSVVELEALLLLYSNPEKSWTASEIARELRIDPSWPRTELQRLCARNVLSCAPGNEPVYRYAPRDPAIDQAVGALAKAYEDRRVTIIGLIFSKPVDKLKTFADAFRIRKEQTDG